MTRTLIAAAALAALLVAPVAGQVIDDDIIYVTTDAGGAASVLSRVVRGRVAYIYYRDGHVAREDDGFVLREDGGRITREGFADTADFTITCNRTGEGLWTESNITADQIVAPTKAVQDQVGADRVQFDHVWCVGSAVKIVVAQGGNAQTAVFELVIF